MRQQAIFILLGGTAQVQGNHLGSAVPISTLRPGEIFGDMSFLASAPASASVVALQAVEIQAIDHAALREAMAENPRLTADFYRLLACKLAARLRYVTEEVIALAQTTADTGQERRASDQSE